MRASVYPAGRGTGLTCVSRRAACSSAAEEEKSCPLLVFLPDKAGSTLFPRYFFPHFVDARTSRMESTLWYSFSLYFSLGIFMLISTIKKSKVLLDVTEDVTSYHSYRHMHPAPNACSSCSFGHGVEYCYTSVLQWV